MTTSTTADIPAAVLAEPTDEEIRRELARALTSLMIVSERRLGHAAAVEMFERVVRRAVERQREGD